MKIIKMLKFLKLFAIEQIKRKLGFTLGYIVMCEECGGLFSNIKCIKHEIVRKPRRGESWIDHDVFICKHCQKEKESKP